jgi:hypothetical protein
MDEAQTDVIKSCTGKFGSLLALKQWTVNWHILSFVRRRLSFWELFKVGLLRD